MVQQDSDSKYSTERYSLVRLDPDKILLVGAGTCVGTVEEKERDQRGTCRAIKRGAFARGVGTCGCVVQLLCSVEVDVEEVRW